MDHHSLSPVPLSDGTAMTTMATDMSDLADLAELASAADAMDVTGSGDSADAEGATDTSDTPNDAPTATSPSSDAAVHTPGSPLLGSPVRRRPTLSSTSTSTSSRPRTRAGTGRPLKINYPKKRVSVTCDVCRARKARCDARRRACSFCAQLEIDCVYRRGGSSNGGSNNGNGSVAGSTPSTPKNDSLSKTDIVARLGRLESLLRKKESSVSSPSPAPVPVPVLASVSATSPLKDAAQPTGDSPVVLPPPTPSPVVPFSVVSPYVGGHSPEHFHHHAQHHQQHPQHHDPHLQHHHHHQHSHEQHHHDLHHQHHPPTHLHHESLSPYVATPSDHSASATLGVPNIVINDARADGPLPLFGYRLDSLSRLGPDADSLPSLRALCYLDVDTELETELFGQSTAATGLLLSSGLEERLLDLSPRRCWSLEQAFSRDVLPWCPIIEQHECAALVASAAEDGFPRCRLETAVALLVLALGSFARESGGDPSLTKNGGALPGIDYFHAGRQLMHNAAGAAGASARYSIMRVQCDLLVTFYFLFSLKPILAFEVLSSAGLRLLMLLQLRSSSSSTSAARQAGSPASSSSAATATGSQVDGHDDPTYDERLHRAYWKCYLLEHELQAYVSFSSRLLQLSSPARAAGLCATTPQQLRGAWHVLVFVGDCPAGICSSMQDDPGYYSKKRGGRSSNGIGTGGVAWNEHMLDAPMLVEEVTLQLLSWHANLAAPVSFPLDEPAFVSSSALGVPVLRPLLDPHKVFLRAQIYAVPATLRWRFVVQLLTDQMAGASSSAATVPATNGPGVDGVAASLHYAVLHVYAVEPLMQDRHLMLFANIAGFFCVTMLLLGAHGLPQLAAIQHPGTEAAVRAALATLRIWQGEPNVQAMVAPVEALARSKGVHIA